MSIAQHRKRIADLRELVQPVADINQRLARRPQLPDDIEQHHRLFVRQYVGGLIEDEDPRLHLQGLSNLHDLLLGHAEAGHRCTGIQVNLEPVK